MRIFIPRNRLEPCSDRHFSLQLFGTPRTFQIPDSAVTNGKGSYNAPINFPVNQRLLFVMSDATGFGSGGTSLITQVGQSVSGNNCNTTDPGVDFSFNLDSALTQCRRVHRSYVCCHQHLTAPLQGLYIQRLRPGGSTGYDHCQSSVPHTWIVRELIRITGIDSWRQHIPIQPSKWSFDV